MTAAKLLEYLSPSIYFVTTEDDVYLMDEHQIGDSDYEYGIFKKLK